MNDEERNELVKKSFENVLKKLANNPEELMDNHKLQIKYNNVLKEKIKLQSNWNSLREWLEVNDRYSQGYFKQVLEYMKELESGDEE